MKLYQLECEIESITGDTFIDTIMVSENLNKINHKAKVNIDEFGNVGEYFINIWDNGIHKKRYEYIYNEGDI